MTGPSSMPKLTAGSEHATVIEYQSNLITRDPTSV
jgi:hypothetical protein